MSIRKLPKAQEQYRINRSRLLGLLIEGGEIEADDDGIWLKVPTKSQSGMKKLKAGESYSIKLPHHIKIDRNVAMVSLAPEVANKAVHSSFPTFLSWDYDGELVINITMKEDCEISNLVKVCAIELTY